MTYRKMKMKSIIGRKSTIAVAVLSVSLVAGAAYAQGRDPAYQSARTNGQIGEKTDGYLDVVGSQSANVSALMKKINLLRRQVYTKTAVAQNVSVETAAFLGGCKNIVRTTSGEKYQAPDGSWKTRGAETPVLDSRCP